MVAALPLRFAGKNLYILFLLLVLSRCSPVRLIQEYDAVTDERITALQEKTARYFVELERNMGTSKAAYENYVSFFDEVQVDLDVLRVRSKAFSKSEISQQQFESIQKQFESLEKLHKLGFSSFEELVPAKNAIENSFAAILQLQMALKNRAN